MAPARDMDDGAGAERRRSLDLVSARAGERSSVRTQIRVRILDALLSMTAWQRCRWLHQASQAEVQKRRVREVWTPLGAVIRER